MLRTLSAANDEVRIWSAACADGREPYSLSMLAHDDPQIDESSVSILGSDISEPALETARKGVYEESRTVDFAEQLSFLDAYEQYINTDERQYSIADQIQERVEFERHDLINDDPKSGFDLVVCRNLFIYIDNEYKQSMLRAIAKSLRPKATSSSAKPKRSRRTLNPPSKSTTPDCGSTNEIQTSRCNSRVFVGPSPTE